MSQQFAIASLLILLPAIIVSCDGLATGAASGAASGAIPRIFNWKEGDKCPADYFMLDCNHCTCINGILPACTLMGCSTPNIRFYQDGMECPAGQKFKSDCNDCDCHEDGKSATCTNNKCSEES